LPSNVVLAKNLVGKQFSKVFFATEDATDFENFKEGDKRFRFRLSLKQRADLVGIKYEQLMPLVLPYQNPENAFRVISGDFVTTEDGTGMFILRQLWLMMLK
jgi:isoleucyl-tRNA synthetase